MRQQPHEALHPLLPFPVLSFPSQHPSEVPLPQHSPAPEARATCERSMLDGPGGSEGPLSAAARFMPAEGGLRPWYPSDPCSALCLCSPKEAWR